LTVRSFPAMGFRFEVGGGSQGDVAIARE